MVRSSLSLSLLAAASGALARSTKIVNDKIIPNRYIVEFEEGAVSNHPGFPQQAAQNVCAVCV